MPQKAPLPTVYPRTHIPSGKNACQPLSSGFMEVTLLGSHPLACHPAPCLHRPVKAATLLSSSFMAFEYHRDASFTWSCRMKR